MIRFLLFTAIGLSFGAVNSSVGIDAKRWEFWAYVVIIVSFSVVADSRWWRK